MAKLRREIAAMKPSREAKRLNRRRNSVPSVAIAGYTNAGKSSLLNRLTDAGVLVENALFATLDPTVRKAEAPGGKALSQVLYDQLAVQCRDVLAASIRSVRRPSSMRMPPSLAAIITGSSA